MAEALSWLTPLLGGNERAGVSDGSRDRHRWLAPEVSEVLLQPLEEGEKHLWSWAAEDKLAAGGVSKA